MHELSIAQELVDSAAEQVIRSGAARAVSVTVRLGTLFGVVASALQTAFHAARVGTPLDTASLIVEEVRAAVYCQTCNAEQTLPGVSRRCPICHMPAADILRGVELELIAVEVVEWSGHAPMSEVLEWTRIMRERDS